MDIHTLFLVAGLSGRIRGRLSGLRIPGSFGSDSGGVCRNMSVGGFNRKDSFAMAVQKAPPVFLLRIVDMVGYSLSPLSDLFPAQGLSDQITISFIFGIVPACLVYTLVYAGAEAEKCYWNVNDGLRFSPDFTRKPLTYGNFLRWLVTSLGLGYLAIMKFLLFGMWIKLGRRIILFFWIIHSRDRLLCGIWGALGGCIAFLLFGSSVHGWGSLVTLVIRRLGRSGLEPRGEEVPSDPVRSSAGNRITKHSTFVRGWLLMTTTSLFLLPRILHSRPIGFGEQKSKSG